MEVAKHVPSIGGKIAVTAATGCPEITQQKK
jgi:hypothetical protein